MEDSLAPPAPPASLAAPVAAAAPTSLFLTRRRSHLDSASYRTLSRLFSHFLHVQPSRDEPHSRQEADPAAANPIGGTGEPSKAGSPPKDAGFNPRRDVEQGAALGTTLGFEIPAPSGIEAAATNPISNLGVAPQGPPEREVIGVEPVENLEEIVVTGVTHGKTIASVEELTGEPGRVVENDALRSMKACLVGEAEESTEVAVSNGDEHVLLDALMTNLSGLIDDANVGTMPMQSCGVSRGEPQTDDKVAERVKELGCSSSSSTKENIPVSNSNGDGFEEGEIEGDMQAVDSDPEDEPADDQKLEGDYATKGSGENESSGCVIRSLNLLSTVQTEGNGGFVLNKESSIKDEAQLHVLRAQAVSYDEVVEWNETPLHDDEKNVADALLEDYRTHTTAPRPGKRKRHLTEERKAKKTKNKRIKRALQREADGVKRLKLTPIIKPKVVKDCRFFLHGKCHQGSACKFSHDSTPLTKSKPCTHFARGCCLKGDDCPYDHELSKYPCHKFVENGMCARRDKCKFSHVVPSADGPPTKDTNKSDVSLVSKKAFDRERTSIDKISPPLDGEPLTFPTTEHDSILKNFSSISPNGEKASACLANGAEVHHSNEDGSESSILHQDALSTAKHMYTDGSQNKKFGGPQDAKEDTNAKPIKQTSALLFDEKNSSKVATSHPCSETNNTSFPVDSTAVPGSESIQHEVSEASRILQDFLFGTGS